MRFKFSGLTRRPAFIAVVTAAGMVYVAVNSFGVEPGAVGRVLLISLALFLMIAVPAGLLVAAYKLGKKLFRKDKGN